MKGFTRPQKLAAKRAVNARIRARYKKLGLRCDGKPLAPRRPCGCRNGRCLLCMKPGDRGYFTPAEIKAMYADYTAGLSLTAVGAKHGIDRKSVGGNFTRRGLALRPQKKPALGFGVKIPEPTAKELAAMIAGLKKIQVPPALKQVWKTRWPLARRKKFVQKMREKFPGTRPTSPLSAGLEFFEYGTPAAHAILDRLNIGRTSQTKVAVLKPGSEGVIYGGILWLWVHSNDRRYGYQKGGPWRGRFFLHRWLWEKYNRRAIPAGMTVIHADGNKNNFAPENLKLRSMADCMGQNTLHRLPPAELRACWERAAQTYARTRLQKSRALTAALLNFDAREPGLLATLERIKK